MNYYRKVANVLKIILIANLLVAVVKITLGYLMNYYSLLADGFHAITDSVSNIIALVGIRLASMPPDKDHQYGHYKFEAIAGFFVGVMLLGITFKIIYNAITWLINPVIATLSIENIIILSITVIINILITVIEIGYGKKLKSEILVIDAIHTRTDIFISSGVIISMVLVKLGLPPIIDPILSLVISIFIAYSCYKILASTISILVDRQIIDNEEIKELVYTVDPCIIDVHRIRNRGKENNIFVDLHIIVPGDLSVYDSHDLSHRIHEKLKEHYENIDLYTHIEPDEKTLKVEIE